MPTGASVNDIYTVLYWEYENVNSTVSRYNVSRIESEIGQFIRVTLTGLQPDVIYEWSVDTSNLVMSSQSEFSNFTTVQSGKWWRVYKLACIMHMCGIVSFYYTTYLNKHQRITTNLIILFFPRLPGRLEGCTIQYIISFSILATSSATIWCTTTQIHYPLHGNKNTVQYIEYH